MTERISLEEVEKYVAVISEARGGSNIHRVLQKIAFYEHIVSEGQLPDVNWNYAKECLANWAMNGGIIRDNLEASLNGKIEEKKIRSGLENLGGEERALDELAREISGAYLKIKLEYTKVEVR